MGWTNVIHTHVEGAGDMSSFKLQPHQAACRGFVSHPQAHAQDHTSYKLQKQSAKTLIRGFLSFYYSRKKRTNIQNISIFPKNMFLFFFQTENPNRFNNRSSDNRKTAFQTICCHMFTNPFFFFFKKKGKKGKNMGGGYKSLRLYVSYYFIQSAHTRWMALKGQHVRCSKHTLSSRRNRYMTP